MIFSPDMCELISAGKKTVTRRPVKLSEFEWTSDSSKYVPVRHRYVKGRTYAIKPGRGQSSIGRICILSVKPEPLGSITTAECRLEGFKNHSAFRAKWESLYGVGSFRGWVWRIEFELVKP